MAGITFDTKELDSNIAKFGKVMTDAITGSNKAIANEVLRLANREVPIYAGDDPKKTGGSLQDSGFVEDHSDESIVGYNIAYAAYQHEGRRRDGSHVVKHYTNPRSKSKFLEGPIKENSNIFQMLFFKLMQKALENGTSH